LPSFVISSVMWLSKSALPNAPLNAGDSLDCSVAVTNAGKIAGDEVVQLYLKVPDVEGAPIRALRGFQRIHLEPGAKQRVEFHLSPRDLSMVTEGGDIIVAGGEVHCFDWRWSAKHGSSVKQRKLGGQRADHFAGIMYGGDQLGIGMPAESCYRRQEDAFAICAGGGLLFVCIEHVRLGSTG
jgi:hypothetical protein